MADRGIYLNNTDDQIAQQKRAEQSGLSVLTVGLTVAGMAAIALARRKLSITRAFSSQIKDIGVAAKSFSRYSIAELSRGSGAINKYKSWAKNVFEGLKTPIPTAAEQVELATLQLRKSGIQFRGFPSNFRQDISSWDWRKTMWHGPISPIAPGARITLPGRSVQIGKGGAIVGGGHLFNIGAEGTIDSVISGISSGIMGTPGSRIEFSRAFAKPHNYRTIRQFAAGRLAPKMEDIMLEQRRQFAEEYLGRYGRASQFARSAETTPDLLVRMSAHIDDIAMTHGGLTSSEFFGGARKDIRRQARAVRSRIVNEQVGKKETQRAYELYKFQMRAGMGEPFAYEAGQIQSKVNEIKRLTSGGIKDPFSGRVYKNAGHWYNPSETIAGKWSSGSSGKFYAYSKKDAIKRGVANLLEGTYFRTLEQVTGIGVSSAPNKMTDWISHLVGAKSGSMGDYFIRRYIGGHARLAAVGIGAFTTFQLVNFMARQVTGGWGVTDVAGKMYTGAREFQQHVISQLGLVNIAQKAERAFPGTVKSPLSALVRASAPYWMAKVGHSLAGKSGSMVGLGLGIATALVTWGDITQTPEELHKIYTGEQDIPVRKGRYWMLGKTPFFGGKISYWRPHWYPMMRSRYQYKGQLWSSEAEEIAQNSPIAPLLSPILTGRMWDPYGWEKKHYYDRPYPMTGELFEPTMPFAAILNSTIGGLVKPQRIMHPEYYGSSQSEGPASRTVSSGVASQLGMPHVQSSPYTPRVSPNDPGWRIGEGMYSLSEQMGFSGFMAQALSEKITGRPNFLPEGPVVQSSRRATGYERSYWDRDIGDPGGFTEFFRRVLPHRRRGIEEYNPIPNEMPSWIPGDDYFVNFRTGDPYSKIPMGEARLPGPGYESLHKLHSNRSGEYDIVDKFLILSDVAPYSREYSKTKFAVEGAVRGDKYWEGVVQQHLKQREKLNEEYEFLDLTPPEDVGGLVRPMSSIYRHVLAGITGAGSVLEPFIGLAASEVASGGRGFNPFFVASFPISKFLPYKTARQAYKDYRIQGSEFTDWGNPFRDFFQPYVNKVIDTATSRFGYDFIPPSERKRREYEDYFDKLQYIKFKKLQRTAEGIGNTDLAKKMSNMAKSTMVGMDPYGNQLRMLGSIPKRERAFMQAFTNAEGAERGDILKLVSPNMAKIYRAQWAMRDGGNRGRVNTDEETVDQMINYSKTHNIPSEEWQGWNPEVDMKDVELKVVQNEGMNIHNFDLWESQQRSMNRRPFVPSIENVSQPTSGIENLRRAMQSHITNNSYSDSRIYVTNTPASNASVNMKIRVKRDRSKEYKQHMEAVLAD